MARLENVGIACGDLRLQGAAHLPQGEVRGAVVVCHPHPLYGGDMDNYIVVTLAEALAENGLAALRFNFRGVGQSQGGHDKGDGERQDVLAALAAARELLPATDGKVGLAGYSFGAVMAAAVAAQTDDVGALALISPPSAAPPVQALGQTSLPKLIVAGANDPIAPAEELEKIAARCGPTCEIMIMPDTDHFWAQGFDLVAARIVAWMLKSLAA